MFTHFKIENKNFIRKVTINNPKKKNALGLGSYAEFTKILTDAASDDSVKILVLTGVDNYYSSGNDIGNAMNSEISTDEFLRLAKKNVIELVRAFYNFPKLLMAVVNGPAIGIACTTLALCDVVYACETAYFLTPFSRLGLCAEGCSSYTFPRIMGTSRASEMLFLNYKMSAQEAKDFHFVSRVYKKEDEAKIWTEIEQYSELPMTSIKSTKKLIRKFDVAELEKVNIFENEVLSELYTSEEAIEAILKFVTRRNKL